MVAVEERPVGVIGQSCIGYNDYVGQIFKRDVFNFDFNNGEG